MRFFVLLILVIGCLVLLYYITAIIHMFTPVFGRGVSIEKCMIPFYGWYKLFSNSK